MDVLGAIYALESVLQATTDLTGIYGVGVEKLRNLANQLQSNTVTMSRAQNLLQDIINGLDLKASGLTGRVGAILEDHGIKLAKVKKGVEDSIGKAEDLINNVQPIIDRYDRSGPLGKAIANVKYNPNGYIIGHAAQNLGLVSEDKISNATKQFEDVNNLLKENYDKYEKTKQ